MDPKFHGWDTAQLLGHVRRAVNVANQVIVPSEPARDDAELLGAREEQVVVVPHGVAPYFRPADRELPQQGYLLTVGTLEPRKNYTRLLLALERAWSRDAAPDWLLIARRGWDYEDFLTRMEASKYRKRIRWIEVLPDAELLAAYQGALAFLFPSMHEGFGLAVLEAMACGVPPVVSVKTAPAWVAGPSAMLVTAKNVDSIAEGIERIVSEDAWRRQAGAVALKRARTFSWERCARETAAVYRQAAARGAER
jgi:alpha-1,3-rhamnosyl/mannosyltransferase